MLYIYNIQIYIYVCITESLCCTAEINTFKSIKKCFNLYFLIPHLLASLTLSIVSLITDSDYTQEYIGLAEKFLWFLRKKKHTHFFIFTKNFIEQRIHHFVPRPSAIFQATS